MARFLSVARSCYKTSSMDRTHTQPHGVITDLQNKDTSLWILVPNSELGRFFSAFSPRCILLLLLLLL